MLNAILLLCATMGFAQTTRIQVLGLFHPQDLTVTEAGAPLVADTSAGKVALADGPLHLKLQNGLIAISNTQRAWRASRVLVHGRDGGAADFFLSVPGKMRRRYRGELDISVHNQELSAVITMDLELAVASAVHAESSSSAPLEELKAQAVATRSFYVSLPSGHSGFDFCDTTHCQFLRGPPAENSLAAVAARQTRGMVLTYRGVPFAAYFSSSCGARTMTLQELGLPVKDYPYYAVECPYCLRNAVHWKRELPQAVRGERSRLALGRKNGWNALPSNDYRVIESGGGRMVVEGAGQGHGLGLCQNGAAAMAQEGNNYRQILQFFYPNSVISAGGK